MATGSQGQHAWLSHCTHQETRTRPEGEPQVNMRLGAKGKSGQTITPANEHGSFAWGQVEADCCTSTVRTRGGLGQIAASARSHESQVWGPACSGFLAISPNRLLNPLVDTRAGLGQARTGQCINQCKCKPATGHRPRQAAAPNGELKNWVWGWDPGLGMG